jgi:uncharacterized protein
VRGCVALERGPLVYAIETADLRGGVDLESVAIPDGAVPRDQPLDGLPGADVGLRVDAVVGGSKAEVDAIPYLAWANRGPGGMRVWIPRAHS